MFLFEFSNLDLEDKRAYIISLPPKGDKGRLLLFRDEGDLKYSLWDCDSFLAEMYALNREVLKIEGIELTDDRINLYIDWVNEHNDDFYKKQHLSQGSSRCVSRVETSLVSEVYL